MPIKLIKFGSFWLRNKQHVRMCHFLDELSTDLASFLRFTSFIFFKIKCLCRNFIMKRLFWFCISIQWSRWIHSVRSTNSRNYCSFSLLFSVSGNNYSTDMITSADLNDFQQNAKQICVFFPRTIKEMTEHGWWNRHTDMIRVYSVLVHIWRKLFADSQVLLCTTMCR